MAKEVLEMEVKSNMARLQKILKNLMEQLRKLRKVLKEWVLQLKG